VRGERRACPCGVVARHPVVRSGVAKELVRGDLDAELGLRGRKARVAHLRRCFAKNERAPQGVARPFRIDTIAEHAHRRVLRRRPRIDLAIEPGHNLFVVPADLHAVIVHRAVAVVLVERIGLARLAHVDCFGEAVVVFDGFAKKRVVADARRHTGRDREQHRREETACGAQRRNSRGVDVDRAGDGKESGARRSGCERGVDPAAVLEEIRGWRDLERANESEGLGELRLPQRLRDHLAPGKPRLRSEDGGTRRNRRFDCAVIAVIGQQIRIRSAAIAGRIAIAGRRVLHDARGRGSRVESRNGLVDRQLLAKSLEQRARLRRHRRDYGDRGREGRERRHEAGISGEP
jgi:hypothetical protein